MGAFNGSGTYVRSYRWQTDASNGLNISSSRMDTEDDGFASGLSNCITRDGQSPALANIPLGGFKITGLGAATASTDAVRLGQVQSDYIALATSSLSFGSASGPHIAQPSANRLSLYSDNGSNERIAINPTGFVNVAGVRNIGSGDLQGSGNLRVFAASAGGYAITAYDTLDYTAIQFVRDVGGTPTQVGTVSCTSTTTTYNTTSDATLKQSQGALAGAEAERIVSSINVHRFVWKANGEADIGVFAQELNTVYPNAVTVGGGEKDGIYNPWSVDYSKLVPALIAAIQSLQTRVSVLEGTR